MYLIISIFANHKTKLFKNINLYQLLWVIGKIVIKMNLYQCLYYCKFMFDQLCYIFYLLVNKLYKYANSPLKIRGAGGPMNNRRTRKG